MIKTGCINPSILTSLAHCMHGDKVLITTGNFRFRKDTPADVVYLGLQRNQPTTLDVAKALKDTINIEKIELRALEEKTSTHLALETLFSVTEFLYLQQNEFHHNADQDDVALIIVTGGTEYASNILMTVDR